jgi:hypothetical protein
MVAKKWSAQDKERCKKKRAKMFPGMLVDQIYQPIGKVKKDDRTSIG